MRLTSQTSSLAQELVETEMTLTAGSAAFLTTLIMTLLTMCLHRLVLAAVERLDAGLVQLQDM